MLSGHGLLFDGKIALLAVLAHSLVNPAISSTADKTNYMVFLSYANFAVIYPADGFRRFRRIYIDQRVVRTHAHITRNTRQREENNTFWLFNT